MPPGAWRPAELYDIDGIDNSAATVAALHSRGDRAICYIEIGAAGNYYPTSYYAQLKAAGDLGSNVSGYPEQYININAPSAVSIIESMIGSSARPRSDGVEPDIDDSYTDSTGFHITEQDNIRYDRTLGAYTHSLGLASGQKTATMTPRSRRRSRPPQISCSTRSAISITRAGSWPRPT